MGFFKSIKKRFSHAGKNIKKAGKSISRAAHGKLHLGHDIRSSLPKWARKSFDKVRWSKLVKGRLAGGNNSAGAVFSSVDPGVGYQYSGKSISEMM